MYNYLIDIEQHPIYTEISKTVEKLKNYLPVITSKLPWETSKMFRPNYTAQKTTSTIRK